ncbi:drug/metabolite transporter (DMT)-like permease [Pseudorhizobium tarimense]|uniref:Drug/metabolite transporter (DMT)-like permease n=1 Tax=Pseudorhizobium tarimense TaxID=1079109 RepID=A0ABV2H9U3_9HYPH|nr:DMT family transporter [Pseudorhizobium tarimense]MCJ8520444.1 DMT family transporter [Pseudorhizobium tarimense]
MELWIPITIASAFLQNMRSALQKHLRARLNTTGATFVRFGYGVPFALFYMAVLDYGLGRAMPVPNLAFWIWAVVGGGAQIGATFLLVYIFAFRNFAVGTAYSRTEPAQAALVALVLVGETVTVGTIIAIAISVVGVILISVARTELTVKSLVTSVGSRTAVFGLLSGFLFGISGVSYRYASLSLAPSLPAADPVVQAGYTLLIVIIMQAVAMLFWIWWKDRAQLSRIGQAWRPALLVGFVGATASFGWFTAMTLQPAAVIKALAQIEMLFTFGSSVLVFKEHVNRLEIVGCLLIVLGILALILI